MVRHSSLAATLDAVNEAFLFEHPPSRKARKAAAEWIVGRQGLPGSYAGMFAPTEQDLREGIRLFTGERLQTRAGVAHILGEEACRALILLDVRASDVKKALARARSGMLERFRAAEAREVNAGRPWLGTYCCARCSVAVWRHLAVGGLEDPERHLAAGMKALRANRDGAGRWRRFPFYYTLLALSEIALPAAVAEMRYAAPALRRAAGRRAGDNLIAERRHALVERVLARC